MYYLVYFFGLCAAIILNSFSIENFFFDDLNTDEKELFHIHSAIFDAFIPFKEKQMDEILKNLIIEVKKESFKQIINIPDLKMALQSLFSNIHTIHDPLIIRAYYAFIENRLDLAASITCESLYPIRDFLHSLPNDFSILPIYNIKASDRFKLFSIMIRSEVSFIRKMAFFIRIFYTNAIYESAIGTLLSGAPKKGGEIAKVFPKLPKLKNHLFYNPKKRQIEGRADAIVVGSGASGSVMGSELQKAGLKVIMVEKGPLIIPGAINARDNARFFDTKGWRISNTGAVALANAAVVGGGPMVNIDLAFPPTMPCIRYRFHEWHKNNLIPDNVWQDDEIDKASLWVKKVFKPRKTKRSEINRNNAMLLKGARALGIPTKMFSLNTYKKAKSPYEVTDKKSSFEMLILPAMTAYENPLTLLHNCDVKKVLKKNRKAIGVECVYKTTDIGPGLANDIYNFDIEEGTVVRIYADMVILDAGDIGTSKILLSSNIKNDNISRGFVIHPLIPMMAKYNHEIMNNEGTASTVYIDHFVPTKKNPHALGFLIEAASGPPNLGALLTPGTPKQIYENMFYYKNFGGVGLILIDTPDRNNRIEIKNDDLLVHYELSQADKARFITAIKQTIQILHASGATDVTFNSFESPLFQNDIYEANTIKPEMNLDEIFSNFNLTENQTLVMGAHMMGGNKMGVDPETSVVNGNYEVWGINDLYVTDGSIFPTSVGANPMMTIYAVAKIAADKILSRSGLDIAEF